MLKLNPDPQFTVPVEITVPGQIEPDEIVLTFKYRNRKEIIALWEEQAKFQEKNEKLVQAKAQAKVKTKVKCSTDSDDIVPQAIDADRTDVFANQEFIFKKIVLGWGGIDAEFNDANIKAFICNYPAATNEIIDAYSRMCLESRIKNSRLPPFLS